MLAFQGESRRKLQRFKRHRVACFDVAFKLLYFKSNVPCPYGWVGGHNEDDRPLDAVQLLSLRMQIGAFINQCATTPTSAAVVRSCRFDLTSYNSSRPIPSATPELIQRQTPLSPHLLTLRPHIKLPPRATNASHAH